MIWVLDGLDDSLEVRDTDTGIEMRHHYTIRLWGKLSAGSSFLSDVNKTKTSFTYRVGSWTKSKTHTGRLYLCTQDITDPENPVGDYVIRAQTWEHFSPWETAPALT